MKKITLLIMILGITIGYSQSFPLDFSDPLDLMTGYEGCNVTLVDDSGNMVAQVVGGGQLYDTAQLELAENLDLSDDANNTITFMIKPMNGTTSGNHLLKFEGGIGGPSTVELPFTTSGTSWQSVTLDFGSGLGNYSKVVLFTDFANYETDTYWVDNFAGGTNVAPPPPLPTPSGPAPIPTADPATVVSMYGESYPNTYQYSFGTASDVDLDSGPDVNNALKINFAIAGFGAGYNETNVTTAQYVHFDYWTSDATTFGLYLISNSPVLEYVYRLPDQEAIVQNTWKSVTIPMSYFTDLGFNPTTWFQYKFDVLTATPGTVYFDNVYFTSAALDVADFESSIVKMYPNPGTNSLNFQLETPVKDVKIYNQLGQSVLVKKVESSAFSLDVTALPIGQYFVNLLSENTSITKIFIKK
ncbi:T9SS type A sorting domain-containing protein [Flavobacterium sp. J27]|uniref:T9SS type A sorting domain-containing protein n=1 Tax=Flavobacterium sp. J27 TaxID=2060419 RepID=UPI001031506F|nr:T9SS type A sorting domain-containing protein [Flavobacterium sp. J27]